MIRVLLGAVLLLTLAVCDIEDEPSGPANLQSEAIEATTADAPTLIYHSRGRDIRIPLTIDPTLLVVEASSTDDLRSAVLSEGLPLKTSKSISHAASDNHRVILNSGLSQAASRAAASALRMKPGVRFATNVYTTEYGDTVTLVNRLVVKFRGGVSRAAVRELADSAGLTVLREAEPARNRNTWWFAYPSRKDPLSFSTDIHRHSLVEWAEPDRLSGARSSFTPSDQYYSKPYYLNNSVSLNGINVDVNAETAWEFSTGNPSVIVAVIGSGIDGYHDEIVGARKSGNCSSGWDEAFVEPTYTGDAWNPSFQDCSQGQCSAVIHPDHETAVAGIIASPHNNQGIAGIAPGVKLISARTIPADGYSPTYAQEAEAITWAWGDCDARIVNGSYEDGGPSSSVEAAIDLGTSNGTVFVFAGGNASKRATGETYPVSFPAAYENAIAVGAIDRYGAVADYSPYDGFHCPPGVVCSPAPFYPWNVKLDVVAPSGHHLNPTGAACADPAPHPGADLFTLDVRGSDGRCLSDYQTDFSGTSATAPQVTGAAALLLSLDPFLTPSDVRDHIRDAADAWGSQTNFGSGKLNIGAAIQDLLGALSPSMLGSSNVKPNQTCLWTGTVSGGLSPYSYDWYRNGYWVGDGSSVSLNTGSSNFTLELRVQDSAGQTESTVTNISVDSSYMECIN